MVDQYKYEPSANHPTARQAVYSQTHFDGDLAYAHPRLPAHLPPPAQWPAPYSQALFPPLYDSYLYDFRSQPLVKV